MSDNNDLSTSEEIFDEYFDGLGQLLEQSIVALQTHDLHSSEEAFITAKHIYGSFSSAEEDLAYVKVIVDFIEIVTRLLRSISYSFDERHNKSLEELIKAQKICEDAKAVFEQIPKEYFEGEDGVGLNMFRVLYMFFDRIVSSSKLITESSIEIKNGKYVDEIELYKNAASEMRKVNSQDFGVISYGSAESNLIVMMTSMINRYAEVYEKKAERLEESKKQIKYLTPIDKRVFVVHGHDEGLLRELKEMLVHTFNVSPVILSEERDNGDTIIEKFEKYGRLCAFAFVIITPDDWVENNNKKYFQARPNVLFELGWFCGRYGRSKVRILRQKDTPLPSDLNGIATIEFNERLEEVFRKINRDLEENGIVDKN